MKVGWVKLWRKLADHPRSKDPEWLALWVRILMKANHEPIKAEFDGKVIDLKPGSFITGRVALARESGLHESKVFRTLALLEIEQQIEIERGSKGSIITVLNWTFYQSAEPPSEQPVNSKRTASEQLVNTHERSKECKKEEVQQQGEEFGCNHPNFAQVLAYVVSKMNPLRPDAEQFNRDECWRAWLDFESGRDREGNWYQFSNSKRLVGHWPSAFEDRLLFNRERKEIRGKVTSANNSERPNRNAGTYNQGKGKDFAAWQLRQKSKIPDVQRSGSESDAISGK